MSLSGCAAYRTSSVPIAVSTTNVAHVQRYRRALDPSDLSQERVRFGGEGGWGGGGICSSSPTSSTHIVHGKYAAALQLITRLDERQRASARSTAGYSTS